MKLIDLLVKELPKRGGWPEGAVEAEVFTYERGLVNFWTEEGKSFNGGGNNFRLKGLDLCEIESVTRAQYESALAASDGWVEWRGGECPVLSSEVVVVKFRDGQIRYPYSADGYSWHQDGEWDDIIAYRLQQPGINSRANYDRLEQDLNECIGQDVAAEWDGEGLPPVGVECEYSLNSGRTWSKCKIDYILGTQGLVMLADVFEGGQWVSFHEYDGKLKFRPLRTEAEKAREAAETAMRTCLAGTGAGITPMAAKGIYDAIAAGKIPGVKLEGK
jgi:hypothetical protein